MALRQAGRLAVGLTLVVAGVGLLPLTAEADVAQYRAVVQAEPSLLSFYPFDGDVAPTAVDRKAPLQNGTLSGAAFSGAAGTVGSQSVQGARVALGSVPDYEFADGSGTVEMFLYQTSTAAYNPCFFAGRDDSQNPAVRYSLHGGANGAQLYLWNGSAVQVVATPVSMLNTLVHVAYVFNAGTLTVYFNGAPLVTWNIPLGAGTGRPFQIGASGPANQEAWPGRIDEVALYSEPLSAASIAAHYNAFLYQADSLLQETYAGLPGAALSGLTSAPTFPDAPSSSVLVTNGFVAMTNVADNFGRRLSGWVVPPQSGSYTFWIAAADEAELWLGTSEDPVTRRRIAAVTGTTPIQPMEWTAEPGQRSQAESLVAGQSYYIEALHKAGVGLDHLAVRWELPGGAIEQPIPASRLRPYGFDRPRFTQQPVALTVIEPMPATFSVDVFRRPGVSYQWRRNGEELPGATANVLTLPATSSADSNAVFQCVAVNAFGTNVSDGARLTVLPDRFPPLLKSVSAVGGNAITLTFDEPLGPASTNGALFSLSPVGTILSVRFGLSPNELILVTSPLGSGGAETLTVGGVVDRYGNVLSPAVTWSLSGPGPDPLPVSVVRPGVEPLGPATRRGPWVVSELQYHPPSRPDLRTLEFIELHNTLPWAESLAGWRLSGEVDFEFPEGTVVPPGGYLVVAPVPGDLTAVYGIANVVGGFTNRLNNAGGRIRLRDRAGGVAFEVEYRSDPPWPAAADGGGHSLVLARPSFGMGDPRAWAASRDPGGSPGGPEPAPLPGSAVWINEFLANGDGVPDYVELFNASTQAVQLAGFTLSDDASTNKHVLPPGTVLGPLGFLVLTEAQLGFALSANGETIWWRDPSGRVLDAVRYDGQQRGVATGRTPDGAPDYSRLTARTPGAPNARRDPGPVVIREIQYHPISGRADEEHVTLENRTAEPVGLGGWRLRGAVRYTVPSGLVLEPFGRITVAADAARLLANDPSLSPARVLGNFEGQLSNRGEALRLEAPEVSFVTNGPVITTNVLHYTVAEVPYGTGGRWGRWSDGGGSCLVLLDPAADPRRAANWGDSDESGSGGWRTVEFTGLLDNGQGTPDRVQILAQGEGEFLVDDVEVLQSGVTGNRVANPGFESGATGWLLQGSHSTSFVEDGVGVNGSRALHVRATSRGDTSANRIQAPLTAAFAAGQTAILRVRVRWLRGHPEMLIRLRGSWLEASGSMLVSARVGAPAAVRTVGPGHSTGPAISDVAHHPVLPAAGRAVTVVARVDDPNGVGSVALRYRMDPGPALATVPMVHRGGGWFSAEIPAQPGGTLAAFHVAAVDGAGEASRFPSEAPVAGRECLVRWGEPVTGGTLGSYRFWMTQATRTRWEARERNSNEPLDVTFVDGAHRVIYNANAQYSGSPFHTGGFNSPLGGACDYTLGFPDDDRMLGETGMILAGPGTFGDDLTFQREQMLWWMAREMGGPALHRRFVRVYVNGQLRQTIFEDTQQPNGEFLRQWFPGDDDGDLFKAQDWIEFADDGATFLGGLQRAVLGRFPTTNNILPAKRYRWMWAPRAVTGPVNDFTNFFTLVETLNLTDPSLFTAQVEALIDVESWSRALAVQRIVGNWDSWGWSYGKNMYAYKPRSGRWAMIPWDLDFSYGTVGMAGGNPASDPPTADLFSNTSAFDGGSPGDPVALRFRNDPQFRRAYARALLDAANGPMADAVVQARLAAIQAALQGEGFSPASPDGIRAYIASRRGYILTQLASLVNAPLAVTNNGGADFTTSASVIRLAGTAPARVQTLLINGAAYPITWTSPTNWSVLVPLASGTNILSVTGADPSGEPVPGLGDLITVVSSATEPDPAGAVVFDEIHYNPVTPGSAFVELFNRSTNVFRLGGWRIDGLDYTFPPGAVITNGQYLVLAADRQSFGNAHGAGVVLAGVFEGGLDNDGEVLSLVRPGLAPAADEVVDRVWYESLAPWPAAANGSGPSLQLIDAAADNARVGNWSDGSGWRFFSFTGAMSTSRLSLFFDQPGGDIFLDDLSLVAGTVAGAGPNLLANGGFESALAPAWIATGLATNSHPTNAPVRSGGSSLHFIQAAGTAGLTTFYQDVNPPIVTGGIYTLSGWYIPGTGAGTNFTLRAGSSFQVRPSLRPIGPTPGVVNLTAGFITPYPTLWLNEVQPRNLSGPADGAGEREPWVELHNPGSNAVSLAGLALSDSLADPGRWLFPADLILPAGGFLVVWCDGEVQEATAAEPHAGFRLGTGAGLVVLSRLSGGATEILDYLRYGLLPDNQSHGSVPDGQPFYRGTMFRATPGGANDGRPAPMVVFINEWMAANSGSIPGGLADPVDGDFEDWFELYNPGATPVDLAGAYLTDDPANPFQFEIPGPGRYVIPAGGHLLVWADGETGQNATNRVDLHVNFSLRAAGEAIGLYAADGTRIDLVTFTNQVSNVSEGRVPDGGARIAVLTAPSPRSGNGGGGVVAPLLGPIELLPTGEVRFIVATEAGRTYRVEYTADLASPEWLPLGGPRAATGSSLTVTDSGAAAPRRFYRVVTE